MVRSMMCAVALVSTTVIALSQSANCEVLFEGYSKIISSGVHVGYTIQRYEFDSKKKEFSTISIVHTGKDAGNITESLTARSNMTLQPVSYQYTSIVAGKAKTIDAVFKQGQMTATIRDDKTPSVIKKKIDPGVILSSFLAYLMLQGKVGLKPGTNYGYNAIAEEDATVASGTAFIEKEEQMNGISTFKVTNSFKGATFESYVTFKGEVIATRSPKEKLSTELVATMQEATAGQSFNNASVRALFGETPQGTENAIARKASSIPKSKLADSTPTTATPKASASKQKILDAEPDPGAESPKKSGVPPGKGIISKPETQ